MAKYLKKIVLSKEKLESMKTMGGAAYAMSEGWDICAASMALHSVASLVQSEAEEPGDIQTLADIMYSLLEFIRGEISEMERAAREGDAYQKSIPAEVKVADAPELNLSYAKSLGIATLPDMAVKYVALDEIKGYTFLWGGPKLTDVEQEYFTKDTNFWDDAMKNASRPLTWDHAQDAEFKAAPVIGQIVDFGDDEVGRWYVAKLDRSHRYRKAIDELIKAGKLGTSSDSAPQYIQREKKNGATWLKEWPWFASALTDTPAEPRMIGSLEILKSLGITLPDASRKTWDWNLERSNAIKLSI